MDCTTGLHLESFEYVWTHSGRGMHTVCLLYWSPSSLFWPFPFPAPEWYWAEPFCIGSTESILKIIFKFYFFYSVFTLFKSLERQNQGKCFLSNLGSEIIVHLSELLRDGATPLATGCIVSILPGRTLGKKHCAPLVWHIHQPEAVRWRGKYAFLSVEIIVVYIQFHKRWLRHLFSWGCSLTLLKKALIFAKALLSKVYVYMSCVSSTGICSVGSSLVSENIRSIVCVRTQFLT